MTAGVVGLAIAVVAGGVLAVGARDLRRVLAGLAVTMAAAPLLADPMPAPLSLAARLAGAALAIYLLWIVFRGGLSARGSAVGWPADALLAAACAIAGVAAASRLVVGGAAGLDLGAVDAAAGPRGAPAALGAGFALAALAIGPLLAGRDVVRLGSGLLLAIHAGVLIRTGLVGAPPPLEQLATGGLVAVLAASIAALASGALRATGDLELVGRRAGAHRVAGRPVLSASPQGPAAAPPPPSVPVVVPVPASVPPPDRTPGPQDAPDAHPAAIADPTPGPVVPRSAGTRRIPGR